MPVMSDGLVGGLERVFAPPEVSQAPAAVVERAGEGREKGVGVLRGQLPVESNGLIGGLERPAPEGAQPVAKVVERRREVREKASGRWAASCRYSPTASSVAWSASSRRPRSLRMAPRLLSDMARSGRKASGRWAASCRRMRTASSVAWSASSRRPRSLSLRPRLLSDVARSGRKASGRWAGGCGRPRRWPGAPPRAARGHSACCRGC